jgi:hypothetical protein
MTQRTLCNRGQSIRAAGERRPGDDPPTCTPVARLGHFTLQRCEPTKRARWFLRGRTDGPCRRRSVSLLDERRRRQGQPRVCAAFARCRGVCTRTSGTPPFGGSRLKNSKPSNSPTQYGAVDRSSLTGRASRMAKKHANYFGWRRSSPFSDDSSVSDGSKSDDCTHRRGRKRRARGCPTPPPRAFQLLVAHRRRGPGAVSSVCPG